MHNLRKHLNKLQTSLLLVSIKIKFVCSLLFDENYAETKLSSQKLSHSKDLIRLLSFCPQSAYCVQVRIICVSTFCTALFLNVQCLLYWLSVIKPKEPTAFLNALDATVLWMNCN